MIKVSLSLLPEIPICVRSLHTLIRSLGLGIHFESLWSSLRTRLDAIQSRIRRYALMISDATLKHVERSHAAHVWAIGEFAQEDEENQTYQELLAEVAPPLYDDLLASLLDRSNINLGRWLEREPAFSRWLDTDDTASRCIWINGIPGSGE